MPKHTPAEKAKNRRKSDQRNADLRKEATRLTNKVVTESDKEAAGFKRGLLRKQMKDRLFADLRSGKIISSTDNLK